jgi:hypothetical protein
VVGWTPWPEESSRRCSAFVLCSALLLSGSASAEALDWQVEERADAPTSVRAARNVRDALLGFGDAFFDANTAVFGSFALTASQLCMGASDAIGLLDDNPVTQYVSQGVVSKNLAKVAYLWHLAGAESLLGSHGLELERWAASDAALLNPLLSDDDVAAVEGPRPLDPLAFVGESMFHADTYRPQAPFVVLGAALVVDAALRPAASVLRIAQQDERADALDTRASDWFRRALVWGW